MIDEDLILFIDTNLTRGAGSALAENGSGGSTAKGDASGWVEIGKGGLSRDTQFITIVEDPGTTALPNLTITCELTIDGGTTSLVVATHTYEDLHRGQKVSNIGQQVPWQEFTGSDIMIRALVAADSNGSADDWDRVIAAVGSGETQHYGRAEETDDLSIVP